MLAPSRAAVVIILFFVLFVFSPNLETVGHRNRMLRGSRALDALGIATEPRYRPCA